MRKIRIGIDGDGFYTWGGGIDFIAMIAEALESTGKVETYLLAPKSSIIDNFFKSTKCLIKAKGSLKRAKQIKASRYPSISNMLNGFATCTPNTKIITYYYLKNRFIDNFEDRKEKCCLDNNIDILLPSILCEKSDFKIPRLGYIYDFQHKYLTEFFTDEECLRRDKAFENQLRKSKFVIVNAKSVKDDINKFFPENSSEVIVLPFKPFQKPNMAKMVDLSKYNLPSKYYIVCNQFWMHKDHKTAFDALEKVFNEGYTDIHLVCTGLIRDDRNPDYGNEIKDKINSLNCKDNIHLVGFVQKDEQIAMMINAIGLIQPTLFEGGPGGGATYNAICLGLTALVSDIPVNKEIQGIDTVYFFEKKNSFELAKLMIEHINDKRKPDEITDAIVERNRKEYGEELLARLIEIINKEM